jgi:hypothetical protein
MTKKEKKAEALRLKAEIEAKKPKAEKTQAEKEAEWKKYDERKYRKSRTSNRKAYFDATGKYPVPKGWNEK